MKNKNWSKTKKKYGLVVNEIKRKGFNQTEWKGYLKSFSQYELENIITMNLDALDHEIQLCRVLLSRLLETAGSAIIPTPDANGMIRQKTETVIENKNHDDDTRKYIKETKIMPDYVKQIESLSLRIGALVEIRFKMKPPVLNVKQDLISTFVADVKAMEDSFSEDNDQLLDLNFNQDPSDHEASSNELPN